MINPRAKVSLGDIGKVNNLMNALFNIEICMHSVILIYPSVSHV